MPEKLNIPESNDILKVLLQAINSAVKINNEIEENDIKKDIKNFLKSIEDNAIMFFRENIDRRKEVREKPIMKDMLNFYKIPSAYY